ncbi:hypothetical protein PX554_20490 [Sphingomonas sp. H39-1-10]|uniref:hypothetical protein n=1 Tax=Sphingomonas pollutisoli TaxID=3030829 RepID=UPI0023BA2E95|nr:hypothetical protein [Sphingomonas pollutisoli]MDF0490514.1 hypothetical protein [Sphingomonas pollutisoli]
MKTINLSAAAIAVALSTFAITAPAFAQDAPTASARGHYEWRQSPNYGPRAPFTAPRRVWVSDATQVASCDCDMMKMSTTGAADCMKRMHSMAPPSSASSVG